MRPEDLGKSLSLCRSPLFLCPSLPFSVGPVVVRKYRLSLKVNERNRELHVRARSDEGDASAGVQDERGCVEETEQRPVVRKGVPRERGAKRVERDDGGLARSLAKSKHGWGFCAGGGDGSRARRNRRYPTFPCALLHTPHTTGCRRKSPKAHETKASTFLRLLYLSYSLNLSLSLSLFHPSPFPWLHNHLWYSLEPRKTVPDIHACTPAFLYVRTERHNIDFSTLERAPLCRRRVRARRRESALRRASSLDRENCHRRNALLLHGNCLPKVYSGRGWN